MVSLIPLLFLVAILLVESVSFVVYHGGINVTKAMHGKVPNQPLSSNLSLFKDLIYSSMESGWTIPVDEAGRILEEQTAFPKKEYHLKQGIWGGDGKFSHDYIVSTNGNGSRLVTHPYDLKTAKEHFIIFGGSWAFGEGLSTEESLGSQLAQKLPGYEYFNFAKPGTGLPAALALLAEDSFRSRIWQEKGNTMFLWNFWHVNRINGISSNMFWYRWRHFIHYDRQGRLVYARNHQIARPFLTNLSMFVSQSYFLKLINKENLAVFSEESSAETACKMFSSLKSLLKKRLPESRLYIVPGQGRFLLPWVKPCLEQAKIDYIEFEYDFSPPKYRLADGHPSALQNEVLAQKIAEFFTENSPKAD